MMILRTDSASITFEVDQVEPAKVPIQECPMHGHVRTMLDGRMESCSDYHSQVCMNMAFQPLLAAVYTAHAQHRPLVLSPDALWLTIAQGVAHHMALEGERLRSRFVSNQGRLDLEFRCMGWVPGSPENPWGEAFEGWTGEIRKHVGPELHEALVCDFSTTTPVARAASNVLMMDIFQRYFRYVMVAVCGIPRITLRGTTQDWLKLADKVEALEVFDMPWWLEHLKPIAGQFVRASQGDVDVDHWRNICKLTDEYGGYIINGWVARLFPYLRAFYDGPCTHRNPIFETGAGFQTFSAPSGLSRVPFLWVDQVTGTQRAMEAFGGLTGVSQDPQTLALEPIAGWAVREASEFDVIISRVRNEHQTSAHPVRQVHLSGAEEAFERHRERIKSGWPGTAVDVEQFYFEFESARFFPRGERSLVEILPKAKITSVDWGERPSRFGARGPDDRTWHRFAILADGKELAINLDRNIEYDPNDTVLASLCAERKLNPICVFSEATRGKPGENPVVALSFAELLTRLLDESMADWPYWQNPGFVSYGDASRFTRVEPAEEPKKRRRGRGKK